MGEYWRRALLDRDQLDLEDQRRIRRDGAAGRAALAVGQLRGNRELIFRAFLHELNAFGPAGDDAVQREGGGLAALVGAVEFRAVEQRALVVDFDGERLALWALSKDYKRTDVEYSGPEYRQGSIEFRGGMAVLHFDHVGKGLVSSDGQALNSFMVAGGDGVFFPAKAEISNDIIVITSPQVANPRLVRFAWDEAASPNLFNRDGLPAIPFRTDKPSRKTLHN